jgi:hypothetical protein
MTTRYLAHISAAGPVRYGQLPGSIGVVEAPDKLILSGSASQIGRTEGGQAVWSLTSTGPTSRAEGHPRPAIRGCRGDPA